MKYFLHDTNSFNDEKITELYINFGYEGLGLFYTTLEKLAFQEKPIKTIVLKKQLNVGKKLEKCWSFMEKIEIISSNNGETFNKQLLKYSEKYQVKKEKNAERISKWRENQKNIENVTDYKDVSNTPKLKESKVKESKIKYRKNILISNDENEKLVSEFGENFVNDCYDYLSDYKEEKNYKTKSDYLTIKRWVVGAVTQKNMKAISTSIPVQYQNSDIEDYKKRQEAYNKNLNKQ